MQNLREVITGDGSYSLWSHKFRELFHSSLGAFEETKIKFIEPSMLNRFQDKSLNVLDVCFGLGYNSAFLFKNLLNQSSILTWYGLEIDKTPICYALTNESFRELWDGRVLEILDSLSQKGAFNNNLFVCNLIWGDARNKISKIPSGINFDLIFLDSFSPQRCPELWTIEFLTMLKNKLKDNGYLITYSSSAAVRKALKDMGLKIFNIRPKIIQNTSWSAGTLAIKNINGDDIESNPFTAELTTREIEHLKTKASVPYRDPSGNSTSQEIIKEREKEQLSSKLNNTKMWREKWKMTK